MHMSVSICLKQLACISCSLIVFRCEKLWIFQCRYIKKWCAASLFHIFIYLFFLPQQILCDLFGLEVPHGKWYNRQKRGLSHGVFYVCKCIFMFISIDLPSIMGRERERLLFVLMLAVAHNIAKWWIEIEHKKTQHIAATAELVLCVYRFAGVRLVCTFTKSCRLRE